MDHPDLDPPASGPHEGSTLARAWRRGAGHAGCGGCQAFARLGGAAPAHGRRRALGLLAGGALAVPAWARDGVDVGNKSWAVGLVPAEQVEAAADKQYGQMLGEARQKNALVPGDHIQVRRLRAIADRIIPHALSWNPRARDWRWEVNLLAASTINAFCMPGGKIAFYSGILQKLQLDDEEVATIMGHEVAHALREHARERMGKSSATNLGLRLGAQLLGLGQLGDAAAGIGTQLLTMKFGREDETEADLVGMELAARAGYDPAAGVRLWQKMAQASKGAPPQWLSTHPSNASRIEDIRRSLPKVQGLYDRAPRPAERYPAMAAGLSAPRA